MQDFNAAYAFVTALTNDPDNAVLDWRAIHDTDRGVPALPRRGTLAQVWQELSNLNNQGYGIFATIAAMDGQGRELSNVHYIRAHYVDLDNISAEVNLSAAMVSNPAPWFATNSSAGKYHIYWPVAAYIGNDRFTTVQRKLRQVFDGDRSVIDATRVLRIPGTYNCKYGEPQLVTVMALAGYGQPITVDALEAALSAVQVIDGGAGTRHELGDPALAAPSLAWLQRALDLMDPNDLDRGEWISFSAAIKQSGWSLTDADSLYGIWSNWCARYAANDTAENLKAWNSWRNTEVGCPYVQRRVPTLSLDTGYKPVSPIAASTSLLAMPEPPPLDCSSDILTHLEQKVWFKGCVAIERMGEILVPTGRFMKPGQFNMKYGGKQFVITAAGKMTDEAWKAATRSTMWTVPKADHTRFLPELPFGEIVTDQLGRRGANTYIPVQIKRMNGDVSPFLNHLTMMLPIESDRQTLLDYLAHNIKFPGYKIPWAPMIQSTEGTGKGFIQEMLELILGEMYCYSPKAPELVKSGSTFNAWMRAKLLIIVNEIKVDERRELIEILKPMITDKRVEIQAKGIDQEMEDNCANWIFFSNFKDAIPVNQNGRRYAIFYSALQSKQDCLAMGMDDRYFTNLFRWMRTGGSEIVADYLLNYSIEKGDVPGKAPDTSSTVEAMALSRSPIERAVADAIEDKLAGFRSGWISVQAVQRLLGERSIRTVNVTTLEGILAAMGFKSVGRSARAYFQEDRNGRSHLYHLDGNVPVECYGRDQGYE
jgi:hypothetical protein